MTLHERIRAYIGEMRKATSAVVPAVIANDLQAILEAAGPAANAIELNKLVRYDRCEDAKSGRPVGLIPCPNGRFVMLAEVLPHLTSHGQRDTTACREAFEVFAASRQIDIARVADRYKSQFANWNWEMWQIAWDARPQDLRDVVATIKLSSKPDAIGSRVSFVRLSDGAKRLPPGTHELYVHSTSTQCARKAMAFDALVAAGHVSQDKAQESLSIADLIVEPGRD